MPVLVILVTLLAVFFYFKPAGTSVEWRDYLGGPDRNHYSTLTQINRGNVSQLQKAWEYSTGVSGQIQCNPIIIDGRLFAVTANAEPFALNAATGEEIWRIRNENTANIIMRGVTYWEDSDDRWILYTRDSWLHAVNALTGEPILHFGDSGRVSLKTGLGPGAADKYVNSRTPGTVFEDLIIMPTSVSEGSGAAPGHVQAFHIRNGTLAWVFKTIPEPGELGYDTWPAEAYRNSTVGAANSWAGMAVDNDRAIVYVPTGSAAFDFYGADRKGENLFANTLLALNARTGERIWHFQFVRHDILDRDLPAPPNLLTVEHDGKKVDAVAQVTKQGFVFVFNRETGEPLFPIEEVAAPPSDVPGEETWPTQPLPVAPLPYARQAFGEADINPYSSDRDSLLALFRQSRYEGLYTPLSLHGSIIYPGLDGGAEWGGAAVDPQGIMYVNSNEMSWLISLQDPTTFARNTVTAGQGLYAAHCSACHGGDRKGNVGSDYPSLTGIGKRLKRERVMNIIATGTGRMPGNERLTMKEKRQIIAFLFGEEAEQKIQPNPAEKKEVLDEQPDEYRISGYTKFLDKDGYPAFAPPWGTLNAINLNTGEFVWTQTLGSYPELEKEKGIPPTGSENYGGPVITKSGLLFIAGTKDSKLRVYTMAEGELVWETQLPAAGFATPSTYEADGRQFIVIACGGTKLGARKGDSYVAYTLPR